MSLSESGKRSSPAIGVATAAVALSLMVMIAAVAIVMGFKREITDKVFGFNSHLMLTAVNEQDGDNLMVLTPSLKATLDKLPFVTDYSLQSSLPAILKTNDDFKGVYLKNTSTSDGIEFLNKNIEEGKVPDFEREGTENQILISRMAADKLNLRVGDRINTYFLSDEVRVRPLKVAGIYNSHFDNYDDVFIYGSTKLISSITGIPADEGTSLQIITDNRDNIDAYAMELQQELIEAREQGLLYKDYRIETAHTRGAGYFQWLALLDTNVIVILALMTAVSIITLISGMLIIIADKKRFIGVMKSLGCPTGRLQKIFVYLAVRVTLAGMIIGDVIAVGLLLLQQYTHFVKLDPDSYYIDFVPVQLDWSIMFMLNMAVLLIVYLSLLLPSRYAARISPAESMRYE